ncbi:MAG: LarC family nickel insertion protein [Myxococcota bacterium]
MHLEPVGGVAGDMLLAALLDVGADDAGIERVFASVHLSGLALTTERVHLHGETALHVRSLAQESIPVHRHLDDIAAMLATMTLSPSARARALEIFTLLADVEAHVHQTTRDAVHLHEVGQLDSVLDVVGIVVALESLGNPRVTCEILPSGRGVVETSHGPLECPVPAVRELSRRCRIPLVDVDLPGETITPTGVAALGVLAQFVACRPSLPVLQQGAGAGSKRFAARPNIVRAWRFATSEQATHA